MPPFQQLPDDVSDSDESSLLVLDSLALYPKEEDLILDEEEVSSTLPDDTTSDSSTDARTVRFGPVHVREYNRIVGDHPDVRYGPPIGIGWDWEEVAVRSLDEHEVIRKESQKGLRRLTSLTRRNMLRNTEGVSEEDIQQAEAEVARVCKQREESKNESSKSKSKTQKMFQKIGKRLSAGKIFQGFSAAAGAPMGMSMMSMGMGMSY